MARSSKQVTQEQAAIDLNCSLNTYAKIERGETNIPFLRLVQIANYYNVNIADLVRDDSEPDLNEIAHHLLEIKNDIGTIKNILKNK